MSTLNESIVEDAALTWFAELGYAVGHGPHLAPGEPAAELAPPARECFGARCTAAAKAIDESAANKRGAASRRVTFDNERLLSDQRAIWF